MNRLAFLIMACPLAVMFQNCTPQQEDVPSAATVYVEILSEDAASCDVRFVPGPEAVSVMYALGTESDLRSFEEGTMAGTEIVESSEPFEVGFSGLDADRTYAVFARGVDKAGKAGGIAVKEFRTNDGVFYAEILYLTDRTAGVRINSDLSYESIKYYLGTADDKDGFLNDETQTQWLEDKEEGFTANYFELEPSTEYVFYAIGYDRLGIATELAEVPFVTCAEGDCPKVSISPSEDMDFYMARYDLVPNGEVGKIRATVYQTSDLSGIFDGPVWDGDIIGLIDGNLSVNDRAWEVGQGETLKTELTNFMMAETLELEIYAAVYDMDGNLAGLQKFNATTPESFGELPEPHIEIKMSDITQYGATYDFTADENTVGFYYNTIDAEWLDGEMESTQWHDYYVHEYLKSISYFWVYGQSEYNYVENTGMPGMRYYVAACPVNANGPGDGWGPLAMEEFETLTGNQEL